MEKTRNKTEKEEKNSRSNLEEALKRARQIAEGIRYGSVTLVIQDGVIVQIDHLEKERLR